MESSIETNVIKVTRFNDSCKPGHIYCVYDADTYHNPAAPLTVKCGRTTDDPAKYCVRTYARRMARIVISNLLWVSDVCWAESTLFYILRQYRVNTRHEVFQVPNIGVVQAAFDTLNAVITRMGDTSMIMSPPLTIINVKQELEKKQEVDKINEARLRKEELDKRRQEKTEIRERLRIEEQTRRNEEMLRAIKQTVDTRVGCFVSEHLECTANKADYVTRVRMYEVFNATQPNDSQQKNYIGKGKFFESIKPLLGEGNYRDQYGSKRIKNVFVGWKLKEEKTII